MDIYNLVDRPTSRRDRDNASLIDVYFDDDFNQLRRVRDDSLIPPPPPPPPPKPKLDWKNQDWMRVYAILNHYYHSRDTNGHDWSVRKEVEELRRKIEFMFREED